MKLHWSPRSPFVRTVRLVAHEWGFVGDYHDLAHEGRARRPVQLHDAIMARPRRRLRKRTLAGALPAHRVERGIELPACLGETSADSLAATGQVEAVAAVFPRTSIKTHSAQCLGEFRIFLAATGTNHDNTCTRSYVCNAIVAHGVSPRHSRAKLLGGCESGNILANEWLSDGLC